MALHGQIDSRFEKLGALLEQQLDDGRHLGVAVCVIERGAPVVDAWGGMARAASPELPQGMPWQHDTRVTVFSTTKGPTATALHRLIDDGCIDLDDLVVRHWPEFARAGGERGKDRITVRHVLSHQSGIPQSPDEITQRDQHLDWPTMVSAMESLEPLWEPGSANGYHAMNFGWIVGELVRRASGRSVGTFFRDEIAGPLGADVHIGLPDSLEPSIAPLIAPDEGRGAMAPNPALADPDSIAARTLLRPGGDVVALMNTRAARRAELPASGGVASARGLARLYAALANGGELGGVRVLSCAAVARACERQVPPDRADLVVGLPMQWALGFQKGGVISPCGPNPNAFGHAGWGGSVAFADPDRGLGVAIVMNRMAGELQSGLRVMLAVKSIYDALG